MKKKFNLSMQAGLPAARRGFTIVELIIYAGILTMFLYVLTSIFTEVLDMQLESETESAVIQDSRYILSRFSYDISRASAIVTPIALGDQTSTLVITIGGVNNTYAVVNGNLVFTDVTGSGSVNSFGTTVSGLSFLRYGNVNGKNGVRIAFTLTSTTQRTMGPQTRSYQATIGLR
jgi:hypothetical protein